MAFLVLFGQISLFDKLSINFQITISCLHHTREKVWIAVKRWCWFPHQPLHQIPHPVIGQHWSEWAVGCWALIGRDRPLPGLWLVRPVVCWSVLTTGRPPLVSGDHREGWSDQPAFPQPNKSSSFFSPLPSSTHLRLFSWPSKNQYKHLSSLHSSKVGLKRT